MINQCENIVLVAALTYCNSGVYTTEERYEQLQYTLKSVKKTIPNVFIVVIDISNFSVDEKKYLENNCDLFINPYDNKDLINKVVDRKSYGEKSYLQYGLDILNNNTNTYNFDNFPNLKNIFKVSGRYYLNDNFDFNKYDNSYNIINTIPHDFYSYACYSSCFKISKQNITSLIESFNIYDYELSRNQYDMERMLYKHVNRLPHINKQIDILGITCVSALRRDIHYE